MSNILNQIVKYSLCVLVFLIPLFFLPFSYEAFEFSKQYLLFFLTTLAFFAWFAKMVIYDKEIRFKKTSLDIYILAFLGIALHYNKLKRETLIIMAIFLPQYLLSGLHHSWDDWSPPDRYLTAFVPLLAVYLGYFFLEFKKGWPRILFWLLAVISIVISLFSLFAVDWQEFYALIGPNVFLGNFPLLESLELWRLFPSFLALAKRMLGTSPVVE